MTNIKPTITTIFGLQDMPQLVGSFVAVIGPFSIKQIPLIGQPTKRVCAYQHSLLYSIIAWPTKGKGAIV
jgi:hypothetical protein